MLSSNQVLSIGSVARPSSSPRMVRRKLATRAKFLQAAYKTMVTKGIEATTLQDISKEADIGFGTFYNYFSDKDDLAGQVLDCIIHDIGKRNDIALAEIKAKAPNLIIPSSIRLLMREAMEDSMWQWWVRRPDLLFSRIQVGFKPFGIRDLDMGVALNIYEIAGSDVEAIWKIIMWILVGGMREAAMGNYSSKHENLTIEAIFRVLGVAPEECKRYTKTPLPEYPSANIDFYFSLPSQS